MRAAWIAFVVLSLAFIAAVLLLLFYYRPTIEFVF